MIRSGLKRIPYALIDKSKLTPFDPKMVKVYFCQSTHKECVSNHCESFYITIGLFIYLIFNYNIRFGTFRVPLPCFFFAFNPSLYALLVL